MLTNLLQVAEPIMRESDPGMTLSQIFMAGGWHFMAILTLILVCALFAAWKAPAWVETLGRVAIAMGVYAFLSGVADMANTCAQVGETFPFSEMTTVEAMEFLQKQMGMTESNEEFLATMNQ